MNDGFAAVMLVVALYSAGRLVAARAWSRPIHVDIDVAHVLMGVAMAGMLDPGLNPIGSGVWEVVFSLLGLWFLWRCYQFLADPGTGFGYDEHVHRLSRRVIHLVMSSSMLYMYLAAAATTGSGMSMTAPTGAGANFVGLPLLFVATLFASAVWQLDGLSRYAPSRRNLVGTAATTDTGISTGPRGSWEHSGKSQGETSQCQEPGSPEPGSCPQPSLAPRLEMGCHIAMCITMGYMLILVL